MKTKIQKYIPAECPWRDTLYWYSQIDSTNVKAKELAQTGAPEGTCVIAGFQSAGKGRMGRSFSSPEGMGMYLSVILRPGCTPDKLMHLTCAVAVAVCNAVEAAAGIRPGIKWINDLVLGKKKLGGILTELGINPVSGTVDYAIVGIGINCLQQAADFPAKLQDIATSLQMLTGKPISPAAVAGSLIHALWKLDLLGEKKECMAAYKENCITLGKDVQLHRAGEIRQANAVDLDENGCLIVEFPDGTRETVGSGEASIRGMFGYI